MPVVKPREGRTVFAGYPGRAFPARFRNVNIDHGIAGCLVVCKGTPGGMMRVAAVLTLALAVTLAALAYEQHKGSPPDVSPPANNSGRDMPNVKLPSGWANPNAGGTDESVNNGVGAGSPPAAAPATPVDSDATASQSSGDDKSNATSGDDANGGGWGTNDSNAPGGSDSGDSDSSATSGSDTGASDSGANGADNSAGASDSSASGADDSAGAGEMSNGSGDSEGDASADSDSGDSGDSNTDSGGSDTSSDSGDASGWK